MLPGSWAGKGVVHNYRHLWKRTQRTLGGRGSGTTVRFFRQKSTFILNRWQCIIKYATCLESGQYAHICRSSMYNNTFEALFLTSKRTQSDFLWTQTVAPHRGFCMAAQRRYRFRFACADRGKQGKVGPLSGGGPKSAICFTKQLLFAWLHS